MRRLLHILPPDGVTAAALIAAGLLLAFAPDAHLPMMARAFLWPCSVLFGVLAIAAWSTGRRWSTAAALIAAILAGTPSRGLVQSTVAAGGEAALRVAQMNVLQFNDRHADVVAVALASDADVIAFEEVDPAWSAALVTGLGDAYPHRCVHPAGDLFGIAVFSRLPLGVVAVRDLLGSPMIAATVRTPAGPVDLLAVHARSPDRPAHFRLRNAQFGQLVAHVTACANPVVLVGDLNAASWDDALVTLGRATGLREHPRNLRPSWPAFAGLALVPIDHVLVHPALAVESLSHFTIPGSDHRGLLADIVRRP